MGFSQNHIIFDKDNNYSETKTYLWTTGNEFKTDVFKFIVCYKTLFNFSDVSDLQKEIGTLEFKEDIDYTISGLTFTAKLLM